MLGLEQNSFIGSNSIIESNVSIGDNCIVGSFVIIKNSLIFNNVHIQDGAKIGVKGFGFIPIKNKNYENSSYWKSDFEKMALK